uniref:Secreted protein n=1 Tax=Arundo donax TaxID=35708 RepID=A0A0A9ET23_ARUDO
MWWVITFSRFGLVFAISSVNHDASKKPPGARTSGFDGLLRYMLSTIDFRVITSAAYWSAPIRVPTPLPLSSFPSSHP